MSLLMVAVLIVFSVITASIIFAVFRLRHSQPSTLESLIKTYPDVRNIARAVKQSGATHYEYVGTGIVFYRTDGRNTEIYTAELSHELKRFETMWSSWQASVEKIPERALTIPEVF